MQKRMAAGVVGLGGLMLAGMVWAGPATIPEGGGAPQLMPPHRRLLKPGPDGRLQYPAGLLNRDVARIKGLNQPRRVPGRAPLAGTIRALAVLVDFSDKVRTAEASFFNTLIFEAPKTGRGSVRDYYDEVSYGQVDIVTVNLPSSLFPSSQGWWRATGTYAYYVDGGYGVYGTYPHNCQKLAEDVIAAVDSVVDFSDYDNDGDGHAEPIMIIHAGPGAERTGDPNDIWSHSWGFTWSNVHDGVQVQDYVTMPEYWVKQGGTITLPMTIGVFAHEMGHGFWGLPDLYDRDDSSEGIGYWSLMASGSWNGTTGNGDSPAWPDAWSRIQMGFAAATPTTTDATSVTVPQALDNPWPDPTIRKLDTPRLGSQEYFLIENRQQVLNTYDQYLPGEGLLIWHVDEAMWDDNRQNDYECRSEPHSSCSDSYHPLVALEQADEDHDLDYGTNRGDAGDSFPGTSTKRSWTATTKPETSSWYAAGNTGINVTNISDPSSVMTFDLALDPTLSIGEGPTVTEGTGVVASFVVTLAATSLETVTVDFATTGVNATLGVDFAGLSGTLTFAPGQLTRTITVPILNDAVPECSETFHVTLSNPVEALLSASEATGTILDDDLAAISVSIADASVVEGNAGITPLHFTVTASPPVMCPPDITFTTRPGTAQAVADFAPLSGHVTIPEGQTSTTISIAVRGDRVVERDEMFSVNLLPSPDLVLGDAQAVGRILNDDHPGISIGNVILREGRTAVLMVRLSAAMSRTVTVRFTTVNGTALAPKDYNKVSGVLSFAPGVTAQAIRVPTRTDALAESSETFTVVLSSPVGAPLVGTGIGTATIQD